METEKNIIQYCKKGRESDRIKQGHGKEGRNRELDCNNRISCLRRSWHASRSYSSEEGFDKFEIHY